MVPPYGVPTWCPHMVPPHGAPTWCPHMVPPHGAPIWCPHFHTSIELWALVYKRIIFHFLISLDNTIISLINQVSVPSMENYIEFSCHAPVLMILQIHRRLTLKMWIAEQQVVYVISLGGNPWPLMLVISQGEPSAH